MIAMATDARLGLLAEEISRLDAALIERERDSLELMGDESDLEQKLTRVTATRIALDRALRAYFIENEAARRGTRRAA